MAETYQKGEYIRYACNGVCLVDDVRLDRLTKKEPPKEFYILKPVSNPVRAHRQRHLGGQNVPFARPGGAGCAHPGHQGGAFGLDR